MGLCPAGRTIPRIRDFTPRRRSKKEFDRRHGVRVADISRTLSLIAILVAAAGVLITALVNSDKKPSLVVAPEPVVEAPVLLSRYR